MVPQQAPEPAPAGRADLPAGGGRPRDRLTPPTAAAASAGWGAPPSGRSSRKKLFPALLDRHLARAGYDAQQTGEPKDPADRDNFDGPLPGDRGAHGRFDRRAERFSVTALAREALGRLVTRVAGPR